MARIARWATGRHAREAPIAGPDPGARTTR